VPLLVVRHASAGNPSEWKGDDRLRPLDEKGWRQARGLPALLAARPLDRLVSSPALRCTQTLEPLAVDRGLDMETAPELMEGSSGEAALGLLGDLGDNVAFCTHGDVLEHLFGEAGKKGSTRVVELRDGEPVVLEYLKPPA
jgi:phosphohistidine phosphatase SixA